jgi:hypothetical protein
MPRCTSAKRGREGFLASSLLAYPKVTPSIWITGRPSLPL